jgi:hypothetical protein
VSHLIIYGGFVRGLLHRDSPEKDKKLLELQRTLIREGWGSDQDAYREFFTSQFIPDGSIKHLRSLNQLQRIAATPEVSLLTRMSSISCPRSGRQPWSCTRVVICACHSARVS